MGAYNEAWKQAIAAKKRRQREEAFLTTRMPVRIGWWRDKQVSPVVRSGGADPKETAGG